MKNKIVTLILISFLSVIVACAQNNSKNNPAGTWKFDAPYAPEGYNSGTIIVALAEQNPTTTMSFTGTDFKIPGENVKAVKDSVLFTVYVQGEDVKVMLKIENDSIMSGKAVYSEGEVPLTLIRAAATEANLKQ